MRRIFIIIILTLLFFIGLGYSNTVQHPCVFYNTDAIENAKKNISQYQWAYNIFQSLKSRADFWIDKSDDYIRSLAPQKLSDSALATIPGSFASPEIYADQSGSSVPDKDIYTNHAPRFIDGPLYTVCPKCGKAWPWKGGGGVCSLDRPRTCQCPYCGTIFPNTIYPDAGAGNFSPYYENGEKRVTHQHYFIGIWNSYIIEKFYQALDDLSIAYVITGDIRYAHKCAVILDIIADIYPMSHRGCEDYPLPYDWRNPDWDRRNFGRLDANVYMPGRYMEKFGNAYDLLYNSGELDKPSYYNPSKTIRECVETNIIVDGSLYCKQRLDSGYNNLANGAADLVRGTLVGGVSLGLDDYIFDAIDGPYGIKSMLANNIDNDGMYYEGSPDYAAYAASKLYKKIAEIAYFLGYNHPAYGYGVNLFDDEKFQKMLFNVNDSIYIAGVKPSFGDSAPQHTINETGIRDFDWTAQQDFSCWEHLYFLANEQEIKEKAAAYLYDMTKGNIDTYRETVGDIWDVFFTGKINKPDREKEILLSDIKGTKGLIFFRSGIGPNGRGLFLRYGPSLHHGHMDTLNISIIAYGREFTYDIGYKVGSADLQQYFAKLTASHNLVVLGHTDNPTGGNTVSQLQNGKYGGGGGPGASIKFFDAKDIIKVAEAGCGFKNIASDYCYKPSLLLGQLGKVVTTDSSRFSDFYRRTVVMVDVSDKDSYYIDVFRTRCRGDDFISDYFFHARGENYETDLSLSDEQPGSLAGSSVDYAATVNEIGDVPGDGSSYNGYEYIHKVRKAFPTSKWSITWIPKNDKLNARLKLTMLPPKIGFNREVDVVKFKVPFMDYITYEMTGIRARDTGSDGHMYFSIIQPYSGFSYITDIKKISLVPDTDYVNFESCGVKVTLYDGRVDYHLTAVNGITERSNSNEEIRFAGKYGFIREENNDVSKMYMILGSKIQKDNYMIKTSEFQIKGNVVSVDWDNNIVKVTQSSGYYIPLNNNLKNKIILFDNSSRGYTHNSAYKIVDVWKDTDGTYCIKLNRSIILGKGEVSANYSGTVISNKMPFPYSKSCQYQPSHYYDRKIVYNLNNSQARVIDTILKYDNLYDQRTIYLTSSGSGSAGDKLYILDVYNDDSFVIPIDVYLKKNNNFEYSLNTLVDTEVEIPLRKEKGWNKVGFYYKNKLDSYEELSSSFVGEDRIKGIVPVSNIKNNSTILKICAKEVYINGNSVPISLTDSQPPVIEKILVDNKSVYMKNIIYITGVSNSSQINVYVKDALNPIDYKRIIFTVNGVNYFYEDMNANFEYLSSDGEKGKLSFSVNLYKNEKVNSIKLSIPDYSPAQNRVYQSFVYHIENGYKIIKIYGYPNPFRDKVYIAYELSKPAIEVQLKIYTMDGKLINKYTELSGNSGYNEFEWNGVNYKGQKCANGVYLYKIVVRFNDDKVAEKTGKIIIMR